MPDRTRQSGRFESATRNLDVHRLEHESRTTLAIGIVFALVFQVLIAIGIGHLAPENTVARPTTMHLAIQPPRMTRPFVFRKQPITERTMSRHISVRDMRSVVTGITPHGTVRIDCDAGFVYDGSIPEFVVCDCDTALAPAVGEVFSLASIGRAPRSLKTELLDIDDLDTGQYRALITIDPDNRANTEGFVYLSMLWGVDLTPTYKRAVRHLIDAVNGFTNVVAKSDQHLFVGDNHLHESPFVLMSTDQAFELTRLEAENFGRYLKNGGFAVLDNGDSEKDFGPAEASLKQAVRDALGPDARFTPIPNDHRLYHSFFDFDDGPPQGSENELVDIAESPDSLYAYYEITLPEAVYFLEGVFLDDRLAAVYSGKGYAECWEKTDTNISQLRMGVNMVMFALTQEGGIAQQKIDALAIESIQGIDRDEAIILGAISDRLVNP